ncbi:MAG: hypothetical protein CHACPFDD_03861 [Phycisphaerae bacterium]|nr:hypothetical protein [Phycisphaerae bacterium]
MSQQAPSPAGDVDERRFDALTERIIGCAYAVSNSLGSGFLEKVYENALAHELRRAGVDFLQQAPIIIRYDGVVVGDYAADLLVEHALIVELKAVRALDEIHVAQVLNYLKATGLKLALLINFGTPRIQVKRLVLGL